MCIAIYTPAGKILSKELLEVCARNNPDGCGVAFIQKNGRLTILKHMDFEPFYQLYRASVKNNVNSPRMIHFRVGTAGNKTEFNCHPFYVNENVAMMHNGVIFKHNPKGDDPRNDTQVFNDEILKHMPPDFHKNEACLKLLGEYIGQSKLVFLDKDGNFGIANADKGHWVDGVWYSNYSYQDTFSRKRAVVTVTDDEMWAEQFWNRRPSLYDARNASIDDIATCVGSFTEDGMRLRWKDGKRQRYFYEIPFGWADCTITGDRVKEPVSMHGADYKCPLCSIHMGRISMEVVGITKEKSNRHADVVTMCRWCKNKLQRLHETKAFNFQHLKAVRTLEPTEAQFQELYKFWSRKDHTELYVDILDEMMDALCSVARIGGHS